jgi:hypothetical protein
MYSLRKVTTVVVTSAGGAMLVAACSTTSTSSVSAPPSPSMTSSPSSSASASSEAIPCKQINSLRTTLTSLTTTKISASSSGQITKDLTTIQADVTALKGKAGGAFSGQISQLNSSINEIKKAAGQLSSNPATAVKNLTAGIAALKVKAQPMIAEMKAACP